MMIGKSELVRKGNKIFWIDGGKKRRTFTLPELLIAIAITGILAALVVVNVVGAQLKSRDASRKNNARNVTSALAQFYLDNNATYPPANADGGVDISTSIGVSGGPLSPNYLKSTNSFIHSKVARYVTNATNTSYALVWELESSSEPTVTSGNGVYSTDSSGLAGVVAIPAILGNAISFLSSSNQYLTTPTNDAAMNFTGDFTMSAWVKYNLSVGQRSILSHYTGVAGTSAYEFSLNDGSLRIDTSQVGSGLTSAQSVGVAVDNRQWHFVAVTRSAGTINFYLDSASPLVNSSDTVTANNLVNAGTTGVDIGRRVGDSNYYNGQIDEIRVYNAALTPAQIQVMYNNGAGAYADGSEPNLVMGWHFDAPGPLEIDYKASIALSPIGGPIVSDGKISLGVSGIGNNILGRAFVTYAP